MRKSTRNDAVQVTHPDSALFRNALKNDEEIDDSRIERLVQVLPKWLSQHEIIGDIKDSDVRDLKRKVITKEEFLAGYFDEKQLDRSSTSQFRWMSIYTSLFCGNYQLQKEWEAELKKATLPYRGRCEYATYTTRQKMLYMGKLSSLLSAILIVYIENYA